MKKILLLSLFWTFVGNAAQAQSKESIANAVRATGTGVFCVKGVNANETTDLINNMVVEVHALVGVRVSELTMAPTRGGY